jgi:hypothetical protein
VGGSSNICYNCGRTGHFAQNYPTPRQNPTSRPQGHVNHPPRDQLKVVIVRLGRANYTTVEDIPMGEQVLACTFSLNKYPIVILFDYGATHDCINEKHASKNIN